MAIHKFMYGPKSPKLMYEIWNFSYIKTELMHGNLIHKFWKFPDLFLSEYKTSVSGQILGVSPCQIYLRSVAKRINHPHKKIGPAGQK